MRDWFAFLRQHNIPYTTTGPNASRGRVNVKCPFCGAADPSEHMGINLNDKGWSCWRNSAHRGTAAPRLIAALLKCSREEAERINGSGGVAALPADASLGSELRARFGDVGNEPTVRPPLDIPPEFRRLSDGSRFGEMFTAYLITRGYRATQLRWLIETYNLYYTTRGRFSYRIVIPIYDRWRELQTWTARSVVAHEEVRYKTLPMTRFEGYTGPLGICSPKETLLGLPLLWECPNPRLLLICEGPFDAFWVTVLGRSFGVYATCLFGLSMSPQQSELFLELKARFPHMALLLDAEARMQAFRLAQNGLGLGTVRLPSDVKDPAAMSADRMIDFIVGVLSGAPSAA